MSKKKKNKAKGEYKVGYGKPPVENRWKKGESGNPLGGKTHNQDFKKIKNLTQQELVEAAGFILSKNVGDLKAFVKDDDQSVLQRMVAAVAARVLSKGDMIAFDVLLNRLLGKVKNQLDLSGLGSFPINPSAQVVISLPSNGRERVVNDQQSS